MCVPGNPVPSARAFDSRFSRVDSAETLRPVQIAAEAMGASSDAAAVVQSRQKARSWCTVGVLPCSWRTSKMMAHMLHKGTDQPHTGTHPPVNVNCETTPYYPQIWFKKRHSRFEMVEFDIKNRVENIKEC